jgi:hypothetical protein
MGNSRYFGIELVEEGRDGVSGVLGVGRTGIGSCWLFVVGSVMRRWFGAVQGEAGVGGFYAVAASEMK